MLDLGKLRDLDALKIALASSTDILSWSYGEVTKPETINYRTFKPEKGGLFCEQIFGPTRDYECYCGKYKRIRYKGLKCDRCGVQVTTSKVRRERMGHITLASPVAHVWFFKNVPSKLATLIGLSPRSLEMVIYFSSFIVTTIDYDKKREVLDSFKTLIKGAGKDVREELDLKIKTLKLETENNIKNLKEDKSEKYTKEKIASKIEGLNKKVEEKSKEIENSYKLEVEKRELRIKKVEKKLQEVEEYTIISDSEYLDLEEYITQFAEVQIGAEAIQTILASIDLQKMSKELKEEMGNSKTLKYKKLIKRVKLIDMMIRGNVDPSSMIITVLPVIPPDLRPMVALEGGRYATSDLNDLYRRIINRNNRLKRLNDLGAPGIIVRNEKRMLQESVDALFDSSKVRKTRNRGRKEYRSIADSIKGKTGYFRANLLGKRVDYSGRAVIVVGPDLKVEECGLPNEMALELFRPFVIREVMQRGLAPNMKTAKYVIDERGEEIWKILEEVVKNRPVLLNRAPTLHRLSIQAFYPKLTTGKAIQLHPLVCDPFNADFDGDQMSVHVPLSDKAVQEAKDLMMATKNLLKPADGTVIMNPSKDMLLGIYYLTSIDQTKKPYSRSFASIDEAEKAYINNTIALRQAIKVFKDGKFIDTTVGRILFNKKLPKQLGYINKEVVKKDVRAYINHTLEKVGIKETVDLADALKSFGFKYATLSGISLSIFDCVKPIDLDETLEAAFKEIDSITANYQMGLITENEKRRLEQRVWQSKVLDHFDATILSHLEPENPVKLIISAGASKASAAQLRQISAIKGLVADPSDRILDLPILGNYSKGMSSFDYFLTNRGVRKTYMDKGLGTADAGYLTRRLVNVAQNILVRERDCNTEESIEVLATENTPLFAWHQRLVSRTAAQDVMSKDKEIIVKKGEIITEDMAKKIALGDLLSVRIYSPLTCESNYGVCAKCYGNDLGLNKPVELGLSVGIIAAQSIGEPGTQLTMRTFHSGGIVGQNITQGLPRVEEVFEARPPRSGALLSEVAGKVKLGEDGDVRTITIYPTDKDISEVVYKVEAGLEIVVSDNEIVGEGTVLTSGYLPLQGLYRLKGPRAVQKYIINEIQNVYGTQGVSINDKHIEVIAKQMFNRVQIINEGDTKYLAGDTTTVYSVVKENKKVKDMGGRPATYEPILTGITKASRMSESWLDAASFEQTSSVLTESAISGLEDELIGLKENVIIGRRIPTGEEVVLKNA